MNVTLGSLKADSIDRLDELDLLPEDSDLQDVTEAVEGSQSPTTTDHNGNAMVQRPSNDGVTRTSRSGRTGNVSWFEDMIRGSRLGVHSTKRKGYGQSADGSTQVQWEISEYYGEEDEPKKKNVKTQMNTDTPMRE